MKWICLFLCFIKHFMSRTDTVFAHTRNKISSTHLWAFPLLVALPQRTERLIWSLWCPCASMVVEDTFQFQKLRTLRVWTFWWTFIFDISLPPPDCTWVSVDLAWYNFGPLHLHFVPSHLKVLINLSLPTYSKVIFTLDHRIRSGATQCWKAFLFVFSSSSVRAQLTYFYSLWFQRSELWHLFWPIFVPNLGCFFQHNTPTVLCCNHD